MPNQPSQPSWDGDDVMPPLNAQGTPPPSDSLPFREGAAGVGQDSPPALRPIPGGPERGVPQPGQSTIEGSTPGDAVSQAIDAIVRSHSTPLIQSIADENRAIADAVIKLRRGQIDEARADAEAIAAQRPKSAAAHELIGDIAGAAGKLDDADHAYRKSLVFEPRRPTAESKLAHIALQRMQASRGYFQPQGGQPFVGGGQLGNPRRPYAILGSLVLPGVGQLVNGRYAVGGTLIVVTLISLWMMSSGVDVSGIEGSLNQDLSALSNSSAPVPTAPHVSWTFWLGSLLATAAWIYSLIDAAMNKEPVGRPR